MASSKLLATNRVAQIVEKMFDPAFVPDIGLIGAWMPAVSVVEDREAIHICLELPGVRPEDVTIALAAHTLTIRGVKQCVQTVETDRVHRDERTYGSFERAFSLPAFVDAGRIHATFDRGVLQVELPKAN